MRLLVKQGELYAEIFRVGFYKSRHWSVIGEYFLFDVLEKMLPGGSNFHSHFIYVENGDYHFSIKYFDQMANVYVDRKTYYNHIATRINTVPNFNEYIPYERRDKNLDDPLDSFMMGEKSKPWTERPFGYHFGTVAINLDANGQGKLNWDENVIPSENDLVINLEEIKGKLINFGAGLYSEKNPAFNLLQLPDCLNNYEKFTIQDDLILRLNAIF